MPTTTDFESATAPLTLEDWSTSDPNGYARAIRDEFGADALAELGNLIAGADRKGNAWVLRLVTRMNARLNREIDRREAWVVEWVERRDI